MGVKKLKEEGLTMGPVKNNPVILLFNICIKKNAKLYREGKMQKSKNQKYI